MNITQKESKKRLEKGLLNKNKNLDKEKINTLTEYMMYH